MRILLVLLSLMFTNPAFAMKNGVDLMSEQPEEYETAIFAGGCFWCLESEFRALDGVLFTRSGYSGGTTKNPSYQQVTSELTGHAEAVEVSFDPEKTSYHALVEHFLTKAHDPTTKNRQGVDMGTQYRSAIYYDDDDQRDTARELIAEVDKSGLYKNPIVTELEPLDVFYEAELHHQQYYEKYEAETGKEHIRVRLKKFRKKR